jgi:hypothetical protein
VRRPVFNSGKNLPSGRADIAYRVENPAICGALAYIGTSIKKPEREQTSARHMKQYLLSAAILGLTALPAAALQPLHENPTVVSGFYAIGLADEVRKNCSSISPRLITAYYYLKSLEKYARDAGYTEAQIEELVDNKKEKEALRAKIRADLAKRGATPENPEGYCTVGREEIAKDSAAGKLLRLK